MCFVWRVCFCLACSVCFCCCVGVFDLGLVYFCVAWFVLILFGLCCNSLACFVNVWFVFVFGMILCFLFCLACLFCVWRVLVSRVFV